MASLKLQILAEDIRNSNYTNGQDCAITRALARAGRPDLMDDADQIIVKMDTTKEFERIVVVPPTNEQYKIMQDTVFGMYHNHFKENREKYPIQDMEFTIEY